VISLATQVIVTDNKKEFDSLLLDLPAQEAAKGRFKTLCYFLNGAAKLLNNLELTF
jgi:hypothetical protein